MYEYKTRQRVSEIVGLKGGTFDAIEDGYLKASYMPDEETENALIELISAKDGFDFKEREFLELLPEVEYV